MRVLVRVVGWLGRPAPLRHSFHLTQPLNVEARVGHSEEIEPRQQCIQAIREAAEEGERGGCGKVQSGASLHPGHEFRLNHLADAAEPNSRDDVHALK